MWNSPALQLTGIGFFLATTIVGMTLIGRWLDGRFETEPVLTLVFLALGLLTGFYGAFTQLREVLQAIERQRRADAREAQSRQTGSRTARRRRDRDRRGRGGS